MKTKLTLLVLEVCDRAQRNGVVPLNILVNSEKKPLSRYISTKSLDDTLSEVLSKYSNNLSLKYCQAYLSDFFHEQGSNECEVVYTVKMPQNMISPSRYSQIIDMNKANIEKKYARTIQSIPRSV